jgi:hypothetical protein
VALRTTGVGKCRCCRCWGRRGPSVAPSAQGIMVVPVLGSTGINGRTRPRIDRCCLRLQWAVRAHCQQSTSQSRRAQKHGARVEYRTARRRPRDCRHSTMLYDVTILGGSRAYSRPYGRLSPPRCTLVMPWTLRLKGIAELISKPVVQRLRGISQLPVNLLLQFTAAICQ